MIWCSSTVFLSKEELDTILKPENMIRPVKLNIKPRK